MQEETIGGRIRHLRKISRKSQQKLADELHVSQKTVSSWECDRTEPDNKMLVQLTVTFRTTLDYLMTGTTNDKL